MSAIQRGHVTQLPPESPHPGIERRVVTTSKATVQEYRFEAGATFPIHHHPQEQITFVIEGSIDFTAAGEATALDAGGWTVVGPDVEHGITAGPGGSRFLAILVPPRGVREAPIIATATRSRSSTPESPGA